MNALAWIIPIIAAVLLMPYVFALRPKAIAAERERQRGDRVGLLGSAVAIIVILVVARQLGTWTAPMLPVWFGLVALAAVCVAGLVIRGSGLAWIRPGASQVRRIGGFCAALVAGGAVVGILIVP